MPCFTRVPPCCLALCCVVLRRQPNIVERGHGRCMGAQRAGALGPVFPQTNALILLHEYGTCPNARCMLHCRDTKKRHAAALSVRQSAHPAPPGNFLHGQSQERQHKAIWSTKTEVGAAQMPTRRQPERERKRPRTLHSARARILFSGLVANPPDSQASLSHPQAAGLRNEAARACTLG